MYCNLLWPKRELALDAPRGDIQLGYCLTCNHIYNYAFDSSKVEYTQAYENSLHFSPRFQQYATSLANHLIERYDLHGKTIVEIGAGKGDFLIMLCEQGNNRGLGFDPSYEPDLADHRSDRVSFIQDYYSEQYAGHEADLICCRHVLEHIADPKDFLTAIRRALAENHDAVVFFEMPSAKYTLVNLGIWDIIYEHCSYFSHDSLAWIFRQTRFQVLNLAETFSGQFLTIEARSARDTTVTNNKLENLSQFVADFDNKYRQKVSFWQNELNKIVKSGQRAVVWGAGSKGVSFLNVVDSSHAIKYLVDLNPRKHNMYVAGTGQQIVSPEFLTEYQPDLVVIMNPNYEDEIRQRLANMNLAPRIRIA